MTTKIICKRIVVSGHVQGVWFRGSMQAEAQRLALVGWVKNLPNGNVEAVVEGPCDSVSELIRWCAVGPPASRVMDVATHDEPTSGLDEFSVRY